MYQLADQINNKIIYLKSFTKRENKFLIRENDNDIFYNFFQWGRMTTNKFLLNFFVYKEKMTIGKTTEGITVIVFCIN